MFGKSNPGVVVAGLPGTEGRLDVSEIAVDGPVELEDEASTGIDAELMTDSDGNKLDPSVVDRIEEEEILGFAEGSDNEIVKPSLRLNDDVDSLLRVVLGTATGMLDVVGKIRPVVELVEENNEKLMVIDVPVTVVVESPTRLDVDVNKPVEVSGRPAGEEDASDISADAGGVTSIVVGVDSSGAVLGIAEVTGCVGKEETRGSVPLSVNVSVPIDALVDISGVELVAVVGAISDLPGSGAAGGALDGMVGDKRVLMDGEM